MWLANFTHYLMRHRYQTIALVFLGTFIPIIGMLGILVAALFILMRGVVEGTILAVAATLPYLITFFLSAHQGETLLLYVWAGAGVAVLSNILTWACAIMLHRQASVSVIIQIAALVGVLAISVIHLAFPGVADWWGTQLQTYYNQANLMTGMIKTSNLPLPAVQSETIDVTKNYATGIMTAAILFNALFQLAIARWWQAAVFNAISLRKEMCTIRLAPLAGVLFVLSLAFSYMGNCVVLDMMPVLYMLFGMAGLSLMHYLFGLNRSQSAWVWLFIVYFIILFSLPLSLVLIAMLALFDIWLDIRKRVKNN